MLVPIRRQLDDLESIYTLNEVATFIWGQLSHEATVGELAAAVGQEFAGEPAPIWQDLEEFLEQLLSLGAVRTIQPLPDGCGPMPRL